MSLFNELKRRNVFRVGIAYAVATWLLLQVTDIVFPRIGLPDSAVTLVIALLAIGFIPALIFAWAFEMTPEGIKREADVDRMQSVTPKTGRKLDYAIIALLALGMAYFVWESRFEKGSESKPADEVAAVAAEGEQVLTLTPAGLTRVAKQKSVAVLPFTAMSSGEDDGYFADGLTEEILNSLSRLPELLVTARTSSFYFKGRDLPVPEIAATLGVDHIVEGSVRRAGDRVRITAQLIRAEDGFHLWSNTYDRTLEDIFAVQADIAQNIAETLDVVLNDDKRKMMKQAGIGNVEAFIAYQKGVVMMERAHSTSDPAELLPQANRYFDQALAIVPTFTDALIERTDLFGHIIYNHATGYRQATQAELESALTEILATLSLAARSAQSAGKRASIEAERAEFSSNWSSIPAKLDRAFQSRQCYGINWVASVAAVFGWAAEVSVHYKRLLRCDPLSGVNAAMTGQYSLWAGQSESVIELTVDHINTVGFQAWVDDIRFQALLVSGQYRDDPGVYDPNPEGSFFKIPRRLFVYAMENELARAREILAAAQNESAVDDLTLLIVEAALGNREAANAYAAKLDARFAGPFILVEAVKQCFCGAPFDLDATPNFKARIEEAGFHWPPPSPINYPAKDW